MEFVARLTAQDRSLGVFAALELDKSCTQYRSPDERSDIRDLPSSIGPDFAALSTLRTLATVPHIA
jgi:hypothetical protein